MAEKQNITNNTRQQFAKAVTGKPDGPKRPWKLIAAGVSVLAAVGLYFWISSQMIAPQGNNLYGICRVYIERKLQFPHTLRIIQFEQRIPEGEDPNNIKRLDIDITFSSMDGFGQSRLNTVTCGFKTEDKLLGTPWQGILLERVLYDGRIDHGWADTYQPREKKNPRLADDRSEDLEMFNATIPAINTYPPDLTLPWYNIKYMKIEDLQNL